MKTDLLFTSIIQQAQASDKVAKKPTIIEQFMPFVFIIVIVYFLLIRPNQKRVKKHKEFTQTLKRGDGVLTTGGILGKIDGLADKHVILEISSAAKIRVLRSHISSYSEEQKVTTSPTNKSSK